MQSKMAALVASLNTTAPNSPKLQQPTVAEATQAQNHKQDLTIESLSTQPRTARSHSCQRQQKTPTAAVATEPQLPIVSYTAARNKQDSNTTCLQSSMRMFAEILSNRNCKFLRVGPGTEP